MAKGAQVNVKRRTSHFRTNTAHFGFYQQRTNIHTIRRQLHRIRHSASILQLRHRNFTRRIPHFRRITNLMRTRTLTIGIDNNVTNVRSDQIINRLNSTLRRQQIIAMGLHTIFRRQHANVHLARRLRLLNSRRHNINTRRLLRTFSTRRHLLNRLFHNLNIIRRRTDNFRRPHARLRTKIKEVLLNRHTRYNISFRSYTHIRTLITTLTSRNVHRTGITFNVLRAQLHALQCHLTVNLKNHFRVFIDRYRLARRHLAPGHR